MPKQKLTKLSGYSIALYFLIAVIVSAFWIVLFQVSKTFYEEDTTLWGFIPWSDAYFMFVLMFIILPTTVLMIFMLLYKKAKRGK